MHIPAFSIFSAVSELFVTAGVLYVILRNWNQQRFAFPIFLAVLLFEAFVNVLYMSQRASAAASGAESHAMSGTMRLFFALHGMVSLLAFIVFVVLGVFAHQDQKKGRFFFREHPVITWTFLIVWILSVGSGETIFALRYLRGA
jgi:hypothetical protein